MKGISDDLRQNNPDIPWRGMAGMRDVLIHSSHIVDIKEVWKTVVFILPEITDKIQRLLVEME